MAEDGTLMEASPGALDLHAAYLDPSVKLEPLVDRWHAWPHLLSPALQAFNLVFRQMPIVQSFLMAPAAHAAASNDPEMYGGPFLDLPVSAVGAVKQYLADTESRRAEAIAFARSFRDFDRQLQAANGYSLEDYRLNAPEDLRGLIELVYDLNHHPKIRLLEEMFEGHDLGLGEAQEILMHRGGDVDRPFFLSTPRLEAPGGLFLRTPLGSEAALRLCEARNRPIDVVDLGRSLGVAPARLGSYFTNTAPQPAAEPFRGPGVRVRYFGHACLLIESAGTTILVDPTTARDRLPDGGHFTFDDLPARIDTVLISHGHQDHFCPEVLMQLRDRVGQVVIPPNNRGEPSDPSLRRMLEHLGFRTITSIEPLQSLKVPGGAITSLPFTGEHSDLDIHSKQCALVELEGRRICLFVDTDAIDIDVYRRLADRLARPDLMFIGMECFGAPLSWLYGPLLSNAVLKRNDNSRRLSGANCERAWQLTQLLEPRQVGVYAMGQEPWMRYLMGLNYTEDSVQLRESGEFIDRCRAAGTPAERLFKSLELTI